MIPFGIREGGNCQEPKNPSSFPDAPHRPDEDCLGLNVWAPSGGGRRAVMVWKHGGGFARGSGNALLATDGENLVRRRDVVVTPHNHRLNIFEYLDLSGFGGRWLESADVWHAGHRRGAKVGSRVRSSPLRVAASLQSGADTEQARGIFRIFMRTHRVRVFGDGDARDQRWCLHHACAGRLAGDTGNLRCQPLAGMIGSPRRAVSPSDLSRPSPPIPKRFSQ